MGSLFMIHIRSGWEKTKLPIYCYYVLLGEKSLRFRTKTCCSHYSLWLYYNQHCCVTFNCGI